MSQAIICVENLGKKYSLRHEHQERYTALRDVLSQRASKLFSFPNHMRPNPIASEYEEFWALKDLNFEIQQGDRVGIIGRNGAGKSTLLKILSRITEPTTGRIELQGRVASLLEVGTGFHPELTGRENIFLNGAILGMSRQEIKSKFDEIVDFSGVEKFLDTPVKRYSSGMYIRLAFAVAAHLDPEILVVDEVLAVGDAEFQKKCIVKMEEISNKKGRTVLFVSHNLLQINNLCNISILLNSGRTQLIDETQKCIKEYTKINNEINRHTINFTNKNTKHGNEYAVLIEAYLCDTEGKRRFNYFTNETISINIEYDDIQSITTNTAIINIFNNFDHLIFASNEFNDPNWLRTHNKSGRIICNCEIPKQLLQPGEYRILIAIGSYKPSMIHAIEENALYLDILESLDEENYAFKSGLQWPGLIRPSLKWKSERS